MITNTWRYNLTRKGGADIDVRKYLSTQKYCYTQHLTCSITTMGNINMRSTVATGIRVTHLSYVCRVMFCMHNTRTSFFRKGVDEELTTCNTRHAFGTVNIAACYNRRN